MATPGWYPDPAGQPGAFRYWDGAAWGGDLTDNPYAPAPGSAPQPPPASSPGIDAPTVAPGAPTPPAGGPTPYQPTPPAYQPTPAYQPSQPSQPSQPGGYQPGYQGYQQPSWGAQQGGAPASPSSGKGKVVGLALLAVVMVIVLGVGTFFVVRAVTDDDSNDEARTPSTSETATDTATDEPTASESPSESPDESSAPTEEPTEEPTQEPEEEAVDPFTDPSTPTALQCSGGAPTTGVTGEKGNQLTGGGLIMKKVPGFSVAADQSPAFEFAEGVIAPSKVIERTETSGWVAVYALGALTKENGFVSPGQAAGVVLECMAQSPAFYTDFTGASLIDSRAITVDGADAWVMDAEIRIDNPELSVEGDVAKVIVVDTGDPDTYGLFVSVVPIGDGELIDQQQTQEGLVRVQ